MREKERERERESGNNTAKREEDIFRKIEKEKIYPKDLEIGKREN
jgi:hypothetical protein